jgi:predicted outer membrane repeat protein
MFVPDSSDQNFKGGGALYSTEGSALRLTRGAVVSNTANTGNGGGIYGAQLNATLSNSTFRGNRAQGSGGGLYWA